MLKYLIGAVAGGLVGYFVLYRLIGCSTGVCPIVASPYLSTIFGIVLGLLIAGSFVSPAGKGDADKMNQPLGEGGKATILEETKPEINSNDDVVFPDTSSEE